MDRFTFDPPGTAEGDAARTSRSRDSLLLMAQLRFDGAHETVSARVRNLSAGGLMAEIAAALAIDTPLEFDLRGIGRVTGRVAWQTEGRIGVAFDTEIDPLRARKPVGKGRTAATPLR